MITKGTFAQQLHSDRSDKKKCLEFVGKIWPWLTTITVVNHHHNHGHGSVWLSYQHVLPVCIRCFSYKIWKEHFFIVGHKWQEERPGSKAFQQPKTPLPSEYTLIFLRWEKFCKDQWVNSQNKMFQYWWKPKTQSTSCCLRWSRMMVNLCLSSSCHTASNSMQRLTSGTWRR